MDQGNNVQDENLVNDQVTQALADSGVDDAAMAAPADDSAVPAPAAVPTVPTEPVIPEPVAAPEAEAEPGVGAAEATPVNQETVSAPLEDTPEPEIPAPAPAPEPAEETPAIVGSNGPIGSGSGDDDELMSVKQHALEQLSPLVGHLDLPPEQKFDTYMEILRASDDKSLVQPAFDIAQQIEDEDKKAQALLDVVNEVNYLTQEHDSAE